MNHRFRIIIWFPGANKASDVNPATVVNFPASGCCMCIPAKHRHKCYCGVKHGQDEEDEDTQKNMVRCFAAS